MNSSHDVTTPHDVTPLVLAKAPVTGQVKTRLGADVGLDVAADLAAAALLDTLDLLHEAFPDVRGVVAMAGDLDRAERGEELRAVLAGWTVVPQEGEGFPERIANAHSAVTGPVLQVGMDTPHLHPTMLLEAAAALTSYDAVLGPAEDGGWWLLGLNDPGQARLLADVPTSRDDTGPLTRAALAAHLSVTDAATSYDIDTVAEAERSAHDAPQTRFAAAWRAHSEEHR